jgi:hypothetical protein
MRLRKSNLLVIFALSMSFVLAACGQDTPIGLQPDRASPPAPARNPSNAAEPALSLGNQSGSASLGTPAHGLLMPSVVPNVDITPGPYGDVELPECTPPHDQTLDLPENFPAFPFPSRLVLFNVALLNDNPNWMQVMGYAPLSLDESLAGLLKRVPAQGYVLGTNDQEPGEFESLFSGNGWRGAFLVRSVTDCDQVTLWRVVMLKQ